MKQVSHIFIDYDCFFDTFRVTSLNPNLCDNAMIQQISTNQVETPYPDDGNQNLFSRFAGILTYIPYEQSKKMYDQVQNAVVDTVFSPNNEGLCNEPNGELDSSSGDALMMQPFACSSTRYSCGSRGQE